MSQWINADEKQPETPGRYLVCLKRIAPEEFGGNEQSIRILRYADDWKLPVHIPKEINKQIKQTVTYWMPLPEMPENHKN